MTNGLRLEFIGVGEAFDPVLGNTSVLVHSASPLLIDCGYAVPRNFFARYPDSSLIEGIYFTHFHADHTYGFPGLIGRFRSDKRCKPLTIIGQKGTKERLEAICELAYPGFLPKAPFPLEFIEFDPLDHSGAPSLEWREYRLSFAELDHPLRNFGVRIETAGRKIGISGDGAMTEASRRLFSDVEILIHEAFRFERGGPDPALDIGHCFVRDVVEFAVDCPSIKIAALVHLRRAEREECREKLRELVPGISSSAGRSLKLPPIIIPEPGDFIPG